ncbi:MAG: cytidylate kinase family protein [Candidatus Nanohaloarchaea archaeon]
MSGEDKSSYIDEFRGDHEKNSDLVVTVDGPAGSGKGTLGKFIADKLGINYYSAGDFFREIASEKNMTVEELSEKAGRDVDLKVDRRTLEKGLEENCVIESRLPSRVLGDYSDLRIHVTADLEERARRAIRDQEEGERNDEETADNVEEKMEKMEKRDQDNWDRYMEYYPSLDDGLEIFDVLIDNTEMGIDEQEEMVEKMLRRKFPERFDR